MPGFQYHFERSDLHSHSLISETDGRLILKHCSPTHSPARERDARLICWTRPETAANEPKDDALYQHYFLVRLGCFALSTDESLPIFITSVRTKRAYSRSILVTDDYNSREGQGRQMLFPFELSIRLSMCHRLSFHHRDSRPRL